MATEHKGTNCRRREIVAVLWCAALLPEDIRWRGARVVESTGLENRNTLRGIEGSNPSLSARHLNELM